MALGVRDLDRTIGFYKKHVHLYVVHERADSGMRVAWLADRETDAEFVLVLLEHGVEAPPGPTTLLHIGFAVASREEVDRAAAAARADGILVLDPVYAGPVVGYFCLVEDPDGNHVEFSYGQPINPRQLQDQLAPGPTSKNDPRVP